MFVKIILLSILSLLLIFSSCKKFRIKKSFDYVEFEMDNSVRKLKHHNIVTSGAIFEDDSALVNYALSFFNEFNFSDQFTLQLPSLFENTQENKLASHYNTLNEQLTPRNYGYAKLSNYFNPGEDAKITYLDENGMSWSSDLNDQPSDSYFKINKILISRKGRYWSGFKVKGEFGVTIWNDINETKLIKNGSFTMSIISN
jgi:hypothetical protein